MANFFFFTDPSLLDAQLASQAFGPAGTAAGKELFRVTDIHTSTASTIPAFAICGGLILAQDAGNNLLNLILKPTEQPPFAFPKIKFFTYRGIKKSTLVSGNDVAPSSNNDLTKSIWESQQAKNASAGTSDNAPAEALGIDIVDNGSIDDVFYRDNVSYQLPLVRAGWSLGEFDPAQFGFEIMVEAIGFDPELPLVRTAANIVNVAQLSASPTQPQEFEYWHDKEAILNYFDPCAFFGGFYFHTLRVKHADDSVSKKKKNEVYDDVLKGAHLVGANDGVFFNRNKTYLDIRNEYNHSINYFKNYGTYSNTDINCAFSDSDPLTARNYYASTWPLMVIENSDFAPGNTAARKNSIRISLPDGAGDNPLPTLYVSAGYLDNLFPREPKDKAKLIDLNVTAGFTDEVALAIPNRDDLLSTTVISTYIKLKYFKRFDPTAATPPVSSGTVIRAANYLDNLFAPFAMRVPFPGTGAVKAFVYHESIFVDSTAVLNSNFVSSIGFADDGSLYLFFTSPEIVRKEGTRALESSIGGQKRSASASILSVIESQVKAAVGVKGSLEIIPTINYVDLKRNGSESPADTFVPELIVIGLKKSLLDGVDKSSLEPKYRIYLGFINEQAARDNIGQPYTTYGIALRGFTLNSGVLQFQQINTGVVVYSHGKNI